MAGGDLGKARTTVLALQDQDRVEARVARGAYDRAGKLLQRDRAAAGTSEIARPGISRVYQEFLDKRSEAQFHDLQLADLDPSGNRQAVRTAARAALAVFAADPTAPDDAWTLVQPLPAALSALQQRWPRR